MLFEGGIDVNYGRAKKTAVKYWTVEYKTNVFFFSSQSSATIFHSSAYHGKSESRRKRQHTLRGRGITNAVRKMAPRQNHRTLARRQATRRKKRVEPDQRRGFGQLHVYSSFVSGHD